MDRDKVKHHVKSAGDNLYDATAELFDVSFDDENKVRSIACEKVAEAHTKLINELRKEGFL